MDKQNYEAQAAANANAREVALVAATLQSAAADAATRAKQHGAAERDDMTCPLNAQAAMIQAAAYFVRHRANQASAIARMMLNGKDVPQYIIAAAELDEFYDPRNVEVFKDEDPRAGNARRAEFAAQQQADLVSAAKQLLRMAYERGNMLSEDADLLGSAGIVQSLGDQRAAISDLLLDATGGANKAIKAAAGVRLAARRIYADADALPSAPVAPPSAAHPPMPRAARSEDALPSMPMHGIAEPEPDYAAPPSARHYAPERDFSVDPPNGADDVE